MVCNDYKICINGFFVACVSLEEGMNMCKRVFENVFSSNVVVVNVLIAMYVKWGRIHKARDLFNKIHDAYIVSWNAMIT